MSDAGDLERFVLAQDAAGSYATAYAEIAAGAKRTHWIWFVFPQITGLGRSSTSRTYAIADMREARAYLDHPVLGARLRDITSLATQLAPSSAYDIFSDDDVKFHSCVTLFSLAAPRDVIFASALDFFFDGRRHQRTEEILADQAARSRGNTDD